MREQRGRLLAAASTRGVRVETVEEPLMKEIRILDKLIDLKEDGSLAMDMSYFRYCEGLRMTNDKFAGLFGGPARDPETPITQREMDLAASIQAVTEEAVLRMAREAKRLTGARNLCLAGGVALNCVANGRIRAAGIFDEIWIQPAAGDAGDNATDGIIDDWTDQCQQRIWFLKQTVA